ALTSHGELRHIERGVQRSIRHEPYQPQGILRSLRAPEISTGIHPDILQWQMSPCIADIHSCTESGIGRTVGIHAEDPVHLLTLELVAIAAADELAVG